MARKRKVQSEPVVEGVEESAVVAPPVVLQADGLAEVREGGGDAPAKPTVPTFRRLLTDVMALRDEQGVRGHDREVSRLRCHLVDAPFIDKLVTEIGAPDIREWLRLMAQKDALGPGPKRKLSRPTISRCQSLVSAVFNEAVEREYINVNPCIGVKPKKIASEADTQEKWAYLLPEEQAAIAACEAIPYADRLMMRFAIGTGLRQGEHRHLELCDLVVDGDDPHVMVRIAGRRNGRPLPTKSGKRRKVPLWGDALEAAREWVKLLPGYAPHNPQNLAFPLPSGGLRQQGKFFGRSDTLRNHYKAAGIKLRPHLHHHAMRHSFASNLVSGALGRRWTLEEIRPLMGHSNTATTERYSHLGESAIKRAVRETVSAAATTQAAEATEPVADTPAPIVYTPAAERLGLVDVALELARTKLKAVWSVVGIGRKKARDVA